MTIFELLSSLFEFLDLLLEIFYHSVIDLHLLTHDFLVISVALLSLLQIDIFLLLVQLIVEFVFHHFKGMDYPFVLILKFLIADFLVVCFLVDPGDLFVHIFRLRFSRYFWHLMFFALYFIRLNIPSIHPIISKVAK